MLIFVGLAHAILIYSMANLLLDCCDKTHKLFYNNEYLWKLFRKNIVKDTFDWLTNKECIKLLEKYTMDDNSADSKYKFTGKKSIDIFTNYIKFVNNTRLDIEENIQNINSLIEDDDFETLSNMKITLRKDKKELNLHLKQFKKIFNKINVLERVRLENAIDSIVRNNFDPLLKFDYRRFILDPEYASYFTIRMNEPDKLSAFIALGYSHNIILPAIHRQELAEHLYPLDLNTDYDDNKLGSHAIKDLYKLVDYFDNLFLNGKGPRWLWSKDPSSPFIIFDRKNAVLGQSVFIADPEPWTFDNGFYWGCIVPFFTIQFYIVFNGVLGEESMFTPTGAELDVLFITILSQIKSFYVYGTYLGGFYEWSFDVAAQTGGGDLVNFIHPLCHPYMRRINPLNEYIQIFANNHYFILGDKTMIFKVIYSSIIDSIWYPQGSFIWYYFNIIKIIFILFTGIIMYIIKCYRLKNKNYWINNYKILKILNIDNIISLSYVSNLWKFNWYHYFTLRSRTSRKN